MIEDTQFIFSNRKTNLVNSKSRVLVLKTLTDHEWKANCQQWFLEKDK